MKKNLKVLIIDDKDQSTNIQALNLSLKRDVELEIIPIRTTDVGLRKDDSDHLDLAKLRVEIEKDIEGKTVAWALTDFNLAEKDIDGMDVASILNDIRPSIKILMYSGDRAAIIRKILGKSRINQATDDEVVDAVRKMMEYKIIDCIQRDDYVNEFVKYARRETTPTIQEFFVEQLRQYPDMEFKSCYPKLKGHTFGEIADMIENKSNQQTDAWMQELVEQAIAYLVKINE